MLGGLIAAGSAIGGAYLSSRANKKAAKKAAKAAREAAEIKVQGIRESQERLQPLADASEPAIGYLRRVMASNPYVLSPEQQIAYQDLVRDTNARLSASGLRGAGRSLVAAIDDVNRRGRARFYTENRNRADSAAGRLGATHAGVMSDMAGLDRSAADARAKAVEQGANLAANATTANAGQWGSALGYLGGLVAQEAKDQRMGRPGAYGSYNPAPAGYDVPSNLSSWGSGDAIDLGV